MYSLSIVQEFTGPQAFGFLTSARAVYTYIYIYVANNLYCVIMETPKLVIQAPSG